MLSLAADAALLGAYTVGSGLQQGILTFALREYVPQRESAWINAALHAGGALLYALLTDFAVRATPDAPVWTVVALALLLRITLFDISLNTARSWHAHREGRPWEPVFAVGTSSLADRAIQGAAKVLGGLNPAVLSAGLRGLAAAGTVAIFIWK